MANLNQHQIEEDDPDILALRDAALSSLILKPKKIKRVLEDGNRTSQTFQQEHHNSMNFPPIIHEHHPLSLPVNGMAPLNFTSQRPGFINQILPARQPIYNPGYHHPSMMPRPPFVQHPPHFPARHPMMPVIQPHLNPNFIAQNPHPARFIPVGSELSHSGLMERDDDMPLLPEKNGVPFEPTPPSRLSPRSAQFVAENNKALQRQRQRSFSPGRSRSRSPYAYRYKSRSRSRSPLYKAQISHIARKRTRSRSPNSYIRKSRSPRRRVSPVKRLSPKFADDRNKRRPYKHNGNTNNRDRQARQENDFKDRRTARTPPKISDKQKTENGPVDNKAEEKLPGTHQPTNTVTENKTPQVKEKRVKTEEELEDELLASTDSEGSIKAVDDDIFKVTLDDKDLDFLDDDEEESENEGRFKSKASSSTEQRKPTLTTNSFKSSYPARSAYDKSRNYGSDKINQRGEYRRYKYIDKDDSKRDRKRSRSPLDSNERRMRDEKQYGSPNRKKKSPEPRKSPEPVKETVKSSKVTITTTTSKEKPEVAKDERKVKVASPMFKATFKSVEPPVNEKKKDEEAKKDERVPDRIRLVRASVASKVESVKAEKPQKMKDVEGKRPAIMKRLGGFIKDPGPKAAKAWAREQIVQILYENLINEFRKNTAGEASGGMIAQAFKQTAHSQEKKSRFTMIRKGTRVLRRKIELELSIKRN